MPIYFTIAYVVFFIFAIGNRYRMRREVLRKDKIPGKVKAAWTATAMFVFYHIIAYGSLIEFFLAKRTINYLITAIGLSIYLFGVIARGWAVKTLDRYWSLNVEIRENHPLIKTGPYRYLRHPNYFCHSLEILGFPLIPNAYYMFGFAVIFYLPVIFIRIYLEEKELIKKFGQAYKDYQKEVWGISPFPLFKKGVKNA